MRRITFLRTLALSTVALLLAVLMPHGAEAPKTGPQTEKRFPPLKLPENFKATLFACDPLIEYPSAIALGPKQGTLFVAADFLTGLGTGIERKDEVRLIEDTDGDGYADKSTVFASGLNSIQGLTYHDGTLYAMHAPYLTALRDKDGDGKAEERRDLLKGLGLAPEEDQIRLHNANGLVAGHDGWLYLAMGDRGCDIKRPEGDRLVLEGGGILRCRPDGRDLHLFSTGLRNIYDVALDEDLNVFVRDNENDGGAYKIRVCHSFFGADHGYPYLYYERPEEALAPLADLGLGSSAGGVCYLETQFPPAYRNSLFFCEWGRSVVHFPLKLQGSSFASARETDFAAGAMNDPYGFKPTDLVVDRDGSLLVSDWGDGQRPRRGRGRVYRIEYKEKGQQEKDSLDAASYFARCKVQNRLVGRGIDGHQELVAALEKNQLSVRGRMHAVWALTAIKGAGIFERLLTLAKEDPEPRVRVQAIRAIADLGDPVLARHRLDAGAGNGQLMVRLATLGINADASVQREIVLALGRMRWADSPWWCRKNLKLPDPALAHAALWTIRQSRNWSAVLTLLDEPSKEPFRPILLRAAAGQYDAKLVDGLIERLKKDPEAARRREYADTLARVWKKPAAWTYWGFKPPPRPANTVGWERTEAIEQALDRALADSDKAARLDILRPMLREKIPARGLTLGKWLAEERDAATVAALLTALRGQPGSEALPHLEAVLKDRQHTPANRLLATSLFLAGLDAANEKRLLAAAGSVEDGPILAELLRALGTRKVRDGGKLLLDKLNSPDVEVRTSVLAAISELKLPEAGEPIRKLLDDRDARTRAAAARAVGRLAIRDAAEALVKRAGDTEADVRRASLEALHQLKEPCGVAVAVDALNDRETAVAALELLGDLGNARHAGSLSELVRRQPSAEVLAAAGKALGNWQARKDISKEGSKQIDRAFADIHGGSGVLLGWHLCGPMNATNAAELAASVHSGKAQPLHDRQDWRLLLSSGVEARVRPGAATGSEDSFLAYSELNISDSAKVEFFTTATTPSTIWLDGKVVYERDRPGVPGPYPEKFEANLEKGQHQLLVRLSGVKEAGEFQLRFRRKSATAALERLALASLSRAGNPEAGRRTFFNAEKSLCIKCHRVGNQGEAFGPELTGLGSRFAKAHIIESILEPSRAVSPSFESTRIELKNGKVHNGLVVAQTETTVTLVDNETKKHVVPRGSIESLTKQPGSTMPDGLEKRLTEDEFVDLISYLMSLKEPARK